MCWLHASSSAFIGANIIYNNNSSSSREGNKRESQGVVQFVRVHGSRRLANILRIETARSPRTIQIDSISKLVLAVYVGLGVQLINIIFGSGPLGGGALLW